MKSYLKFLSRNKLYTAIEAVGLVVSLAFVILIGSYAWQQWAVTRENPDRKNIYTFNLPDYPGLTFGFAESNNRAVLIDTGCSIEESVQMTMTAILEMMSKRFDNILR